MKTAVWPDSDACGDGCTGCHMGSAGVEFLGGVLVNGVLEFARVIGA